MRNRGARIRQEVPELAPFTDDELAAYVATAQRRVGPGSAHWAARMVIRLIVLSVIGLLLVPTMWIWGWALMQLYNKYGTLAVVAVISAVVTIVLALLRAVVGSDRPDAARNITLLRDLARTGECARCGYRLFGLSPTDGRASVVCCPECGLVNPAPPGTPHENGR